MKIVRKEEKFPASTALWLHDSSLLHNNVSSEAATEAYRSILHQIGCIHNDLVRRSIYNF